MIRHARLHMREVVEPKISQPAGKARTIRKHEEKLTIEIQRILTWELGIS